MDIDSVKSSINTCVDCKNCNEICDTFLVTKNELQSPNGRLKITKKVIENNDISNDELLGIYTCTLCALCDLECQQNLKISEIIHFCKVKLVEQHKAPLEIHKKIIQNIIDDRNSVSGDPKARLEWLPPSYKEYEKYEESKSTTLLFLGCMSSFRIKESASSSYEILKLAGLDFKIFKDEPCCGEYVYSAGNLELAKKMFKENLDLFKKYHIKEIITTCGGCLYAFNNVYPKYLPEWDIEVKHIVQVIYELEKKGKLKFDLLNKSVTYHDACRMGRKLHGVDIYTEPRYLLNKAGFKVNDLKQNCEKTPCCGAGSGIRGVDSELCIKIGEKIINNASTNEIISSCPLCVFNFRYIDYKKKLGKKYIYITENLLEATKKDN